MPSSPDSGGTAEPEEVHPAGWRGSGIFLASGGQFRLRDFSITFNAAQTEIVDTSYVPELRTDTWPDWLAAAQDACAQADAARADGVAAGPDDEFHRAVVREFRASMLGVAGAAFAVDAFYGSTVEHAPDARVVAKNRRASIMETLKAAYDLKPHQQQAARQAINDVFGFRDQAVHPPAAYREVTAHPIYGLGMEPRFVIFRAENAHAATDFAHRLIWLCLHRPRERHEGLAEWCDALKSTIPEPPAQEDSEGTDRRS